MNRSPSRMSPSGWSSPDVPLPSVSNDGSTKLTLGSAPCATTSRNDGVVTGMPSASVSPGANGCQNGKYFSPHSARNGRERRFRVQAVRRQVELAQLLELGGK